jgi:hypothetical protein
MLIGGSSAGAAAGVDAAAGDDAVSDPDAADAVDDAVDGTGVEELHEPVRTIAAITSVRMFTLP